jgi:hypothetical protein
MVLKSGLDKEEAVRMADSLYMSPDFNSEDYTTYSAIPEDEAVDDYYGG